LKWCQLLAAITLLTAGCSHPVTSKLETSATTPGNTFNRIYEFKGKGRQPEVNHDKTKRVQWVEAGLKERSTVADSLRGGSWLHETYAGGRIGLADGSILKLNTVTLVFGMGNDLESVEGS